MLALDDGKVNAISQAANQAVVAALDRVQARDRVGALVTTGRTAQFCAGFDLDTLTIGGRAP